jgi:two-component system sensor histidine kinase HydH
MKYLTGPETLVMRFEATVGTRVAGVILGIAAVSALHYCTPHDLLHLHNAFQQLYYLPIVLAGLGFGWRGGLAAGLFAGLCNAPYNALIWSELPSEAINQLWDIPLFCAAGVFTGVLGERGRKQREDLERTTQRLAEVYQELQDNFEQMKRAERLFALGQLSAGLAHEVRNPVASIAGAADLLRKDMRLEAKQEECLTIIAKECRRLDELLTHFLAFARPRPPTFRDIDISIVIECVMELARHSVGEKAIALRKTVAPDVGAIECDPDLLKQVLLNLILNAIQATPAGGEILVSARRRDSRVQIDVKDEGPGVSPEIRDRIFDPFFTTKETGTGLGLSVAHQIVEQHGGILRAEGNIGKGTTFSVILPVNRESLYAKPKNNGR